MKNIFAALLIMLATVCLGQDANFTQFYASPMYMNPAFAGAVPQYRATMQYRNQYPNIPNTYETNLCSFDYNWDYYDSGLGAMIVQIYSYLHKHKAGVMCEEQQKTHV